MLWAQPRRPHPRSLEPASLPVRQPCALGAPVCTRGTESPGGGEQRGAESRSKPGPPTPQPAPARSEARASRRRARLSRPRCPSWPWRCPHVIYSAAPVTRTWVSPREVQEEPGFPGPPVAAFRVFIQMGWALGPGPSPSEWVPVVSGRLPLFCLPGAKRSVRTHREKG